MTDKRGAEPLVAGVKKAVVHFSKAALEAASGISDLASGIVQTIRPGDPDDEGDSDGPQKIEIE